MSEKKNFESCRKLGDVTYKETYVSIILNIFRH